MFVNWKFINRGIGAFYGNYQMKVFMFCSFPNALCVWICKMFYMVSYSFSSLYITVIYFMSTLQTDYRGYVFYFKQLMYIIENSFFTD
jgi:hypothetical protein